MKALLRIATKQQYCYIEAEVEGEPKQIVSKYFELGEEYWRQQAVRDREKEEVPFKGTEFANQVKTK